MAHTVTTIKHRAGYWLLRCKTCAWERAAGTKEAADRQAAKHERSAW